MVSIEYREEPEKICKEDKIANLETNFSEMKGQIEELTKKVKKLEFDDVEDLGKKLLDMTVSSVSSVSFDEALYLRRRRIH